VPLTEAEAAKLQILKEKRAQLVALQERAKIPLLPKLEINTQPHQDPPPGDWVGWLLMAGRRAGKSYACAAFIADYVRKIPVSDARMRLIAPTFSDAVESCIKGPSGLLALDPAVTWHASAPGGAVLRWPTGAEMLVMGTHTPGDVDRLRATGGRSCDWFEEAAANRQLEDAFAQAELGRNLGRRLWIASTTPRPMTILKEWEEDPEVVVTHAITHDNMYLTDAYKARMERRFKGTRMYRQEILGEIIPDVEGALWVQRDIDRSLTDVSALNFVKTVVGVDPAATTGTHGIIVVGATRDGQIYVLDDYSLTDVQPNEWASAVAAACEDYGAMAVAEVNHGGRMVEEVLRSHSGTKIPFTTVRASVGKQVRAEPIAILWEAEEQSAHMDMSKDLTLLIDQMVSWVPGMFSPDRVDALVWAATYLRGETGFTGSISVPRGTIPERARTSGVRAVR
jgi:phage terminase large subunit-like protein